MQASMWKAACSFATFRKFEIDRCCDPVKSRAAEVE